MSNLEMFLIVEAGIPQACAEGLARYIEKGIPTGSFLRAVLEGDLYRAVAHADHVNVRLLPEYVLALRSRAPESCFGSPKKVERWIEKGGLMGEGVEGKGRF